VCTPCAAVGDRVCQYRKDGATFAKWRAVFKIGHAGVPSDRAIRENAQSLARYASICQEHGLVPIVEPELTLGPGDYSIGRAAFESERAISYPALWIRPLHSNPAPPPPRQVL